MKRTILIVIALLVGGSMFGVAIAEEPTEKPASAASESSEASDDSAKETPESETPKDTENAAKTSRRDGDLPKVDPKLAKKGAAAFIEVAKVLKSPRCLNCHPNGDRPLQTDESRPHRMNVSRRSVANGLACATCHQEKNSEALGIEGGPPGAPNWHLPPEDTPMIFEGRTTQELCEQLRDPDQNGGKDLGALLHHVSEDALVLWGWNPGGNRTKPPMSHDEFVKHFSVWVKSGGVCPK